MKKFVSLSVAGILLFITAFQLLMPAAQVLAADTAIMIRVEGKKVVFKKKPLKVSGGYSAQAYSLAKGFAGKYQYEKKKKTVSVTKGRVKLVFSLNSKKVMVGKKKEYTKIKTVLKSGIPFIDVLYTAKKLGYTYSKYTASKKCLDIHKKKPRTVTPTPQKTPGVTPSATNSPGISEPTPSAGVTWIPGTPGPAIMKMYIAQDNPSEAILKAPMGPPRTMKIKVVDGNDENKTELTETSGTIEGRGNSSWYNSQGQDWYMGPTKKAPFKLEFSSKVDMLGMGAAKKWVLLANRVDKSLIRNSMVFDIGAALSFEFTARYRFVELYLNGNYKGLYIVTDQMEQDDIRVSIKNASASDPEPNFLLEWDQKVSNDDWMFKQPGAIEGIDAAPKLGRDFFMMTNIQNGVMTNGRAGYPFTYKYPKAKDLDTVPNDAGRKYIQDYVTAASAAIKNSGNNNDYKEYIDLNTFYDFYIVNEFTYNCDAASHSSIYMYRRKGGKLCMGPLWDFDISMGAVSATVNPRAWLMNGGNGWYRTLIRDNSDFRLGLKARWNEVKSIVKEKSIDSIDNYVSLIGAAAKRNHARWGELSINIWDSSSLVPLPKTYEEEISYLKNWLNTRYTWLDTEINKWQ